MLTDAFTDKQRADFFRGYITCALWSSTDESRPDGGDPMDDNYGPDDIDSASLDAMRNECNAWLDSNAADVTLYCEQIRSLPECTDMERCGHDLWLTRNRHGTGFWDRVYGDDLDKDLGERLTEAAHKIGERHLYLGDDGVVYHG